MFALTHPPEATPEVAAPTPAQDFLSAAELTPTLPDYLAQDGTGRPWEPVEITATEDLHTLPEQIALLLRPEPVGGAESLIQANRTHVLSQARARLHQRLATSTSVPLVRQLLQAIQHDLRTLAHQVDAHLEHTDQTYTRTQTALRTWQDHMRQQTGGLWRTLGSWLVGGSAHLSLPQAAALWNEREHLALTVETHRAARWVVSQILDDLTFLLDHLDTLSTHAHRVQTAARQRVETLRRGTPIYAPWDWQVNTPVVADALVRQVTPEHLVTDLLQRLAQTDVEAIEAQVAAVAHDAAARLVAPLTVLEMMEHEAQAQPVDGVDPLLVIGQALLETLTQQAPWQVRSTARLRVETLQVTPAGEPLYQMEHLSTASSGETSQDLGFIQVQLGASLDDLTCCSQHDTTFQEMLARRNLYVLDDLAQAHAPTEAAPTTTQTDAPPPAPADLPPRNGIPPAEVPVAA